MEGTTMFVEVNIKQERPDYGIEENMIYLPASQKVEEEWNCGTDDTMKSKIKVEYGIEPSIVADDYKNEFVHESIKTESCDVHTDIEDDRNFISNKLEAEITKHDIDIDIKVHPLEMETISKADGEDIEDSPDPVMHLEIKSDLVGVEESTTENGPETGSVWNHSYTETYDNTMQDPLETRSKDASQYCKITTAADETADKKCTFCKKAFSSTETLSEHVCFEDQICDVCGDSLIQNSGTKTSRLSCKCGKLSSQQNNVKKHECSFCDMKFSRADRLNYHMLVHTGEKPVQCGVCNRHFRDASSLRRHSPVHTGVKPHKCIVCEKKFSRAHHLKRHILTHTGYKPHECQICGKKFAQSNQLNTHMVIHTGTKPYECTTCQKKFSLAGTLKRHMLTHTRVRRKKRKPNEDTTT